MTAPSATATWREALDEFDIYHVPLSNTGAQTTDDNFNMIISQLAALRRACEAGFTKLDQNISDLNSYDTAVRTEIAGIKQENRQCSTKSKASILRQT